MADSKNTSSNEVKDTPEQSVVHVGVAPELPEVYVDKVVGEGENLYFFPDIQKSVVGTSLEDATKQVQAELDAFKKSEGNN